jgi:hypothetical protein
MSTQVQPAPTAKPRTSVKLREVRLDDYPQIAALGSKYSLYLEPYPQWTHLWINNPAYQEIKGKVPMGWVLENGEGGISGYLGNVPVNYELDGKKLLATATRAWVVDTAYRSFSPLLLGTYFQQRNVDLFLSTTVSPESADAYGIFQGIRVPVGEWDQSLYWITQRRGLSEIFLRQKSVALARPLSYPVSVAVFLYDQLKRGRFRKNADATVLPCACFDQRFDAFWEALRQKKSRLLLAVRSRQVLQWHFEFALQQNAAWIYTIEANSEPAAYTVFLRQDNLRSGLRRVRLADFQCLNQKEAPHLLSAMLHAAIDRCQRERIHMLEVVGPTPALEKSAECLSARRRSLPSWTFCYKPNDAWLGERLKNSAVWEPSLFDGDSSLCSLTVI